MPNRETSVATKVKVNTKILVAIGLLLVGGGFLLASLPLIKIILPPQVAIISLNGGELVGWYDDYEVKWDYAYDVGVTGNSKFKTVSMALYKNDTFVGWIIQDLPAKEKRFNLNFSRTTIPKTEIVNSNAFKLKIIAKTGKGEETSDFSDRSFSIILAPQVTVVSPNGGEVVGWYNKYPIEWKYSNYIGNPTKIKTFSIALYKNDVFYSWITQNSRLETSFSWNPSKTIPKTEITATSTFKIKIIAKDSLKAEVSSDFSDQSFSITLVPQATVVWPNGREVISWDKNYWGKDYNIKWKYPSNAAITKTIKTVSVALYKNDAFVGWIIQDLPAKEKNFKWSPSKTIPKTEIGTYIFKIKIIAKTASGQETFDLSDHPFSIAETYISKKGDTFWKISEQYYKTGMFWPVIWVINSQRAILPFSDISPGKRIVVPKLDDIQLQEIAKIVAQARTAFQKLTEREEFKEWFKNNSNLNYLESEFISMLILNSEMAQEIIGSPEGGPSVGSPSVSIASVEFSGPIDVGNLGVGTVVGGTTVNGNNAVSVSLGNTTVSMAMDDANNSVNTSITTDIGTVNVASTINEDGSMSVSMTGALIGSHSMTADEAEDIGNAVIDATIAATVNAAMHGLSIGLTSGARAEMEAAVGIGTTIGDATANAVSDQEGIDGANDNGGGESEGDTPGTTSGDPGDPD